MKSGSNWQFNRAQRVALWYNQMANFFWSILSFTPIVYFCYVAMDAKWLYAFLIVSVSVGFLPNTFFNAIQLSRTTSAYNRLGIRTAKKFTQDGDLINRSVRRRHPDYNLISPTTIKKQLSKGYMNERFHFVTFLFFLLTTLYALIQEHYWWALSITMLNVIYNVYPILLQQYNRIRLQQLSNKLSAEQ